MATIGVPLGRIGQRFSLKHLAGWIWLSAAGIAGLALAQEPAPVGIVTGDVTLMIIRGVGGSMDLTTPAGELYQCDFDSQSLFERQGIKISPAEVGEKARAEVVSDRKRGRCYARIVRLLPPPGITPARRSSRSGVRSSVSPLESIFPRGNMTVAGVVLRTSPAMIVVRTRSEPEQKILLREDTRFLDSGSPAGLAQLNVNTRVFVRASKTIHNEVEAHQIVWGSIEGPQPRTSF